MSLPVSNTFVAICLTFISLMITVFVVGMLVAVFAFKNMMQRTLRDAKPAINQATDTLRSVSDVARSVQGRVDHIMHVVEDTTDNVSRKVKTTSSMITESISPPLISVSSLMTGVSRGFEIWSTLRRHGGNGQRGREQE